MLKPKCGREICSKRLKSEEIGGMFTNVVWKTQLLMTISSDALNLYDYGYRTVTLV